MEPVDPEDVTWHTTMREVWIGGNRYPVVDEDYRGETITVEFTSDGFFRIIPPHNPDFPDVDPVTGDERETTDENGDPL